MKVLLCLSPAPRQVLEQWLALAPGCTAGQAIEASGILKTYPHMAASPLAAGSPPAIQLGIWGRKCKPSQLLKDGDRLEIYRPLAVDPKVARRERFQKQGAGATGLFAKRKPGAKAGY